MSLVTVMIGVSLVGFSGSMIKDAVKDASVSLFSSFLDSNGTIPNAPPVPPPEPIEEPEVTKVLIGECGVSLRLMLLFILLTRFQIVLACERYADCDV